MGIRQDDPYVGMLREYTHFFKNQKAQDGERYLSPDGKVCFVENDDKTWSVRMYDEPKVRDEIDDELSGYAIDYTEMGTFNDIIDAISMYRTLRDFL